MGRLILYYLVIATTLISCSKQNEDPEAQKSTNISPYAESERIVSEIIAQYGNYDTASVEELLIGKCWKNDSYYEYSENWGEMIFDAAIDGLDGLFSLRYTFEAEGKLKDSSKYDTDINDPALLRSWSFDSETRTLTIDGALSYHLIALGEDTFIWDRVSTGSGYPRYFREVFKARAVE